MARVRTISLAAAAAAIALLGPACTGRDPYAPGTPLGTFHVSAALASSSCGVVPDPWEFDVRLAHEASTLYWVQGGAPISGSVDSASRAVLSAKDEHGVREPDPRGRDPGCRVLREDALDVVLEGASGAAPAAELEGTVGFRGTLVYRFTPTSGSDCAAETAALGGGFDALPCEVRYDVAGTRTAAPKAR